MISPARSISASVVSWPNEKRTAEPASAAGNPIASSTCEATTDPTMQAEPLEAQTPSRSSAIKIVSELNPAKLTLSVLASRSSVSPFWVADGKDRVDLIPQSISQHALRVPAPAARSRKTHSAAAAIPAIAGTFSVPGPALILMSPAELDRLDRQTCAQIKQPGALRSVKFVRGETRRGQSALAQARLHFAERLDHIAVKQNATLVRRRSPALPSAGARRFRCSRS